MRLITILLLFKSVYSSPIIIKSGIVKNHGDHQSGNIYGAAGESGVTSHVNNQGFEKLDQGNFVKSADEGDYLHKDAAKNVNQNQGYYNNENFQQNGEGLVEDSEKKKDHKKGHHKSGFHNTYHKDESGSNSSYFDDSNDEGGDYQYNGKRGDYGNFQNNKQQGSYADGTHYEKDDSKQGTYKQEGHLNKHLGSNKNYNDERYLDDRKQHSESAAANNNDGRGKEVIENHHTQPYYPPRNYYDERQPYNKEYYEKPSVPENKIIIYEDPRVYESENLRYSDYRTPHNPNDRVRLEIRPPISRTNRYYDARPIYEDYYY